MSKNNIENCVRSSLEDYFQDLGREQPHDLYAMMLAIYEKPVLEVVMKHAMGNQSKAALWLGLNRNTLHKKLSEHGLL
ncbi:MAG: Fis family transcriptional regulator [Brachymonas sp.]|nr:Fis family transcriptional regulator [Brachymonas sp.]